MIKSSSASCTLYKKPGDQEVKTYKLNTVTYGTASAPYAAVRCLQELANVDGIDFPLGAATVLNDDMLSGANGVDEALEKYQQVVGLLKKGCFHIRKIHSNSTDVLNHVPEAERGTFVTIGDNEVIKTLGLNWIPAVDAFVYYYEPCKHNEITKRSILSEISRLFDPLGILQPLIVLAKLFMQRLWGMDLDWDDTVPEGTVKMWKSFKSELEKVHKVEVPRFVLLENAVSYQLHGFCDASCKAYGAVCYVRSVSAKGDVTTNVLIAKTKVAPLKTVSLPRLELLGALLLADLYNLVIQQFPVKFDCTHLWTNSMITLRWVTESPHKWTSYVATRVTKFKS